MSDNLDKLLKGQILVKELSMPSSNKRAWIEVALHDEDLPAYPLRLPPYSMTANSPYLKTANEECRFKVRTSSFNADDIENGYDPSYNDVGEYEVINSLSCLLIYLSERSISLDDFIESSQTEYPL